MTAITTSNLANDIDSLALEALRRALPGRVFTPGDSNYDQERAGYSLADQPTPALVVSATSAADVVAAVNFAREQGLAIGVKSTGHGFPFAYQGGLMINTNRMQGFRIDPIARTARVEAGVIWGPVVQEAHRHGLAPLNGSAPFVGVLGYSLSCGLGWLLRRYGTAVDSVIAADVVTADGRLLHVNQHSYPELFWALRGGNSNFGVVVGLEFKLYPVSELYGGVLFFPMEQAPVVLPAYQRWAESMPEEVTSSIVMMRFPPLPFIPEFLRGKEVITVRAAILANETEGSALLRPLRALNGLIADTFRMLPTTELGTIASDPPAPGAARRATMLLKDLSPELIQTILRVNGSGTETPATVLEIRHLGGAMTRVPQESTAFSQRYAPYLLQILIPIPDPAMAEGAEHITRTIAEALQPFATGGVIPNWLGDGDHGVERTKAGFSPEHYARLTELKAIYDPENMFRLNHNIPPASREA